MTITKEFTKEQLIEQAEKNIAVLRGAVERIPGASDAAVIHLRLAEITLASLEAEQMTVNGDMAYAFHHALSDSSLGADEVEEIKTGLRAAFANLTAPPAPISVPNSSAITQHFDTIALEAAREIMCDVNRRHEFLGGDCQLLSRIQCRIDDACRAAMQGKAEPVSNCDELLELIEGMEVSIDVSTCDADAGHRYFGTVTEVSELDGAKNGYILLVKDAEPNFTSPGNSPAVPDGWVMVPKQATPEMINSAMCDNETGGVDEIYELMLAAAPQQEE